MDLLAEDFVEILQSLQHQAAGTEVPEKRRAPRIGHDGWVEITPLTKDSLEMVDLDRAARVRVELCNISSRGMGLALATPMESGEQFIVHLPYRSGRYIHILCTVIHCRKEGGARYSVGTEFTCAVPDRSPADEIPKEQLSRIRQSVLD